MKNQRARRLPRLRRPPRHGGGPLIALVAGAGLLALPRAGLAQEPAAGAAARCSGAGESRVSGTVVDRRTGAPLPAALVRLEVAVGGQDRPPPEVVAAEDGSFVVCAPPGTARARLEARWDGRSGEAAEIAPPAAGVRLAVDLGEPSFLLFSIFEAGTERPVEGAAVRLRPVRLSGVTDSMGRAVLPRVPPGRYEMAITHIGYHPLQDSLAVEEGRPSELRVPLATRVLPLEPLRVTVTGRDPYLVEVGFYDRRERLEEGYFALGEEIRPYRLLSTLFRFKRELLIRFPNPALLLVDGRPARRLGYQRLDAIPLHRIRGLEAMRCGSMPARYLRYLEGPLDCNVVFIWLR